MPKQNRTPLEHYLLKNESVKRSMAELAGEGKFVAKDLVVEDVTDYEGNTREKATIMLEDNSVYGTFSTSFCRSAKAFMEILEEYGYKPFIFSVDKAPTKRGNPCLIFRVVNFLEDTPEIDFFDKEEK